VQPDFWHERWRSGRTGFHLPVVHPALPRHWPSFALAPRSRVLVPLCGKSRDLLWLRDAGHEVIGVELSQIAIESFCAQWGIGARRRTRGSFEAYESREISLLCGDWFDLDRGVLGSIDAVYDRAALVAWPPAEQARYLAHLAALTPAAAQGLLITVEYAQAQMPGPPFSVDRATLANLATPHWDALELERRDVLADEPRMRERGLTRLQEVAYRLTRR
jgi:thiopurine S-methyltransferase